MRAVAQRVTGAELKVDGKLISAIGKGLVVFFGVTHGDTEEKADYIAKKIANLRVFEDENGKMNRSVRDENGEVLFVSLGVPVKKGVFGADMKITQMNDGPVTILLEI